MRCMRGFDTLRGLSRGIKCIFVSGCLRSRSYTKKGRNVGKTNLVKVASDSSRLYQAWNLTGYHTAISTSRHRRASPVVVVATILSIFEEAASAYVIIEIGHGSWLAAYVSLCAMTIDAHDRRSYMFIQLGRHKVLRRTGHRGRHQMRNLQNHVHSQCCGVSFQTRSLQTCLHLRQPLPMIRSYCARIVQMRRSLPENPIFLRLSIKTIYK